MKSVQQRFSSAGVTYNRAADVQATVARRLLEFIPATIMTDNILEVGCGTGLLTAGLRQRFPGARIDAMDLAAGMIHTARRNLPDAAINWIAADIQHWPAHRPYPLIASSSALHWLQPLAGGMNALRRHLRPDGRLYCAMMLSGTLRELHSLRRRLFPHKPPGADLPDTRAVYRAMTSAGLHITDLRVEKHTTRHASAGEMLRRLHAQGVTSGPFARGQSPLTRGELLQLIDAYDREHQLDGGVIASYRVVYLAASADRPPP
ncbi:MAG: methyltransferase domain-containing protein [Kiritimatiellia bacterium]